MTHPKHGLVCVIEDLDRRLREVAHRVGIAERAVRRIVADLEEGGYLSHSRGAAEWLRGAPGPPAERSRSIRNARWPCSSASSSGPTDPIPGTLGELTGRDEPTRGSSGGASAMIPVRDPRGPSGARRPSNPRERGPGRPSAGHSPPARETGLSCSPLEPAGHFPPVVGLGEAAGGAVPSVALTAGSGVSSWPNGPGKPAGGGGGRSGGGSPARLVGGGNWPPGPGGGASGERFPGSAAGVVSGAGGGLLDQGRVELVDPRDEDLVADRQAVEVGDGILVGRPEGPGIPARPVVEQRDRPEVLAVADRVGVRELAVEVCRG